MIPDFDEEVETDSNQGSPHEEEVEDLSKVTKKHKSPVLIIDLENDDDTIPSKENEVVIEPSLKRRKIIRKPRRMIMPDEESSGEEDKPPDSNDKTPRAEENAIQAQTHDQILPTPSTSAGQKF